MFAFDWSNGFHFYNALKHTLAEFWDEWDIWGHPVASSVIIILGSLAQLGTVTTSIVVTKDWVAVIANGNQEQLASKIKLVHKLVPV